MSARRRVFIKFLALRAQSDCDSPPSAPSPGSTIIEALFALLIISVGVAALNSAVRTASLLRRHSADAERAGEALRGAMDGAVIIGASGAYEVGPPEPLIRRIIEAAVADATSSNEELTVRCSRLDLGPTACDITRHVGTGARTREGTVVLP